MDLIPPGELDEITQRVDHLPMSDLRAELLAVIAEDRELRLLVRELATKLDSMIAIGRAKHVLFQKLRWNEERAHAYLRSTAMSRMISMGDLAKLIVDGREAIPEGRK